MDKVFCKQNCYITPKSKTLGKRKQILKLKNSLKNSTQMVPLSRILYSHYNEVLQIFQRHNKMWCPVVEKHVSIKL